jgi:hypothetical protein
MTLQNDKVVYSSSGFVFLQIKLTVFMFLKQKVIVIVKNCSVADMCMDVSEEG